MSPKTKIALLMVILLWASAFVGIRAGLKEYSPEGLALLRYIIASLCIGLIYFSLPARNRLRLRDAVGLLLVGVIGIGIYNVMLNYGELSISSGMASFIISQSPLITAIFASLFLGEQLTFSRMLGFVVSVVGVMLIAVGEKGGFKWDASVTYILIATVASGFYSILQKPFLKKYRAIEAAAYIIWGGTLFLFLFIPQLQHDLVHASWPATWAVVYLALFPGVLGYVAWSYVLAEIPAARAACFLYFMPFVATILGWLWLNEVPMWVSIIGGLLAIAGVWLVNQSYQASRLIGNHR